MAEWCRRRPLHTRCSGWPWTMLVLFGLVLWFWLLPSCFGDLVGRPDVGGWAKAVWTVVLILLPLIGVLAYLVAPGPGLGERRGEEVR